MKYDIPIRIIVTKPLSGVWMKVQRGRYEFLEGSVSGGDLTFEFDISADLAAGAPNFLGKYAQGPKDARFIYVNSGSQAGQLGTCWDRRAKLSLMSVTREQIDTVLNGKGNVLETTIPGVGRDGGPVCASIKGLEWKVAKR